MTHLLPLGGTLGTNVIVSVRGIALTVFGTGAFVFGLFVLVAGASTATAIRLGGLGAAVMLALDCMILVSNRVGGDKETVTRRAQLYAVMTAAFAFAIFGLFLVFQGVPAVGFGLAVRQLPWRARSQDASRT